MNEREGKKERERAELIGFRVSNKDVDNSLLQLVYAGRYTYTYEFSQTLFYSPDCRKIILFFSCRYKMFSLWHNPFYIRYLSCILETFLKSSLTFHSTFSIHFYKRNKVNLINLIVIFT